MRKAPITEMFMHIDDWWARTRWVSPHEPMSEEMLAQHEERRLQRAAALKDRARPYEQRMLERLSKKRAANGSR